MLIIAGKTLSHNEKYISTQAAIKATIAVINSFYNYLIDYNYTKINPVAQIRQKNKFIRKQQSRTRIRRLSETQWHSVISAANRMAEEQPKVHERTLFIMSALYFMYLRISELAASVRWIRRMGHFFRDSDGYWWFKLLR